MDLEDEWDSELQRQHFEAFGLYIREEDAPTVRRILAEQTLLESGSETDGDTFVMKLCCIQLFALGHPEDTLLIWSAKFASFDAGCSIDVELLCGAGLEATIAFLEVSSDIRATPALEKIVECRVGRDFEGFSVADRMRGYEAYYRVT